jgi:diacylglycerol O-acyltransferase
VSLDRSNEQASAAAAGWAAEPRMNELETLMWRSERHPRQSSTVAALMILDRPPDWDRLVAAHEWATDYIPRSRQRVIEPAVPVGPPAWVPDDGFHLDYHLRRTRLSGPGDRAELLRFAQSFAVKPLDRGRPLWEAVLVEGLDDGGAAYLIKMHHSITDGLGGMQLLSLVQSRTREHTPNKPRPPGTGNPAPRTDPVRLAIGELTERFTQVPGAAGRTLAAGAALLVAPRSASGQAMRYVASLRRVLSAPPAKPSPLLGGRTGQAWRFGVLECGLAELKAAAKSAGGSLNDAFVAALLGGLRRYHEAHGVEIDELAMAMPVSLRKADDPIGGNKFAGALFAAPIGVTDPAERIAVVRGTVLSVRTEPALDTFSLVAPLLNRVPSAVGAATGRLGARADLSASNVPGLPYPVYMAGARVDRIFPFGPLPGVAVMAVLVSHVGICCIGLNIDGAAVQDQDVLMRCMREGLDEVLALAATASEDRR